MKNSKFKAMYIIDTECIQKGATQLFITPFGKTTGPGIVQYSKEDEEIKNKYGYKTEVFPLTIEKKNKEMVIEIL